MQQNIKIPFNKIAVTDLERNYVLDALKSNHLSGDGPYTRRCVNFLEKMYSEAKILLTHSCTAALEMAAMLIDIKPGDEVILPSFTFVSTANPFVLRGATPVFIDIDPKTLNLNPTAIEGCITARTKAIIPVHYAGNPCDMPALQSIARHHNLSIIEDAAQAFDASFRGKALGTFGDLGALSFHETKNIVSGEGGCLIVNKPEFAERAFILRDKGTNRKKFLGGEIDKYTWVDIGSSFLPSDLLAALLLGQLERHKDIKEQRKDIWNYYHEHLKSLEDKEIIRRPSFHPEADPNFHIYYIVFSSNKMREKAILRLKERGIQAVFHYLPLHSSAAGMKYGRPGGPLPETDRIAECLLRLPLWPGLDHHYQDEIINTLNNL